MIMLFDDGDHDDADADDANDAAAADDGNDESTFLTYGISYNLQKHPITRTVTNGELI